MVSNVILLQLYLLFIQMNLYIQPKMKSPDTRNDKHLIISAMFYHMSKFTYLPV